MPCRQCGSESLNRWRSEVGVHKLGFARLTEPLVLLFPELMICMVCGFAEFLLRPSELAQLQEDSQGQEATAA